MYRKKSLLALFDFFCPDCRYFGWRETITHKWKEMLYVCFMKCDVSLLVYYYIHLPLTVWLEKTKNKTQLHSILMWSSCMYSSASLSNSNRYISALPIISIISIIGIFVIFLIEDTALKTCQCRLFVPHNQCRHLFFAV